MDFLKQILTNLEGIVAEVPNAQKKHLLRLLMKKVPVQELCTAEVWYRLPGESPGRTLGDLVAPRCQDTNPSGTADPEAEIHPAFRIEPPRPDSPARPPRRPNPVITLLRNSQQEAPSRIQGAA
jgi:hypothetical protein